MFEMMSYQIIPKKDPSLVSTYSMEVNKNLKEKVIKSLHRIFLIYVEFYPRKFFQCYCHRNLTPTPLEKKAIHVTDKEKLLR